MVFSIDSLGGKRFVLTIVTMITTSMLNFVGKVDGATYAAVIIAIVAAFIAGDTTQNIKMSNNAVKLSETV